MADAAFGGKRETQVFRPNFSGGFVMHQAPTTSIYFVGRNVVLDQFWPVESIRPESDYLPRRAQGEVTVGGVFPDKGVPD